MIFACTEQCQHDPGFSPAAGPPCPTEDRELFPGTSAIIRVPRGPSSSLSAAGTRTSIAFGPPLAPLTLRMSSRIGAPNVVEGADE